MDCFVSKARRDLAMTRSNFAGSLLFPEYFAYEDDGYHDYMECVNGNVEDI